MASSDQLIRNLNNRILVGWILWFVMAATQKICGPEVSKLSGDALVLITFAALLLLGSLIVDCSDAVSTAIRESQDSLKGQESHGHDARSAKLLEEHGDSLREIAITLNAL